jgi:hypothetical protein
LTRWVNNFPQKCQFKSFDQWKLTLIFSPYKPELNMLRSCPNRLEFKNECYSTVNQSITESAKNIDICINFMERTKTKPFLKRKKVPKLYFHFWPPKKCPPFFFLIHTWWCENITESPCGGNWSTWRKPVTCRKWLTT